MSANLSHQVTQSTPASPFTGTGLGRLRSTWYRIRFAIQEMNYASRRMVELQVPWSVDKHWHRR